MTSRRDIRRLAMQVLYQMDVRGPADAGAIRDGLIDGHDAPEAQQAAFNLAAAAWEQHAAADALTTELAPNWPAHRQPPVDRAILRLAYHEIISGFAPAKVVINESVELAKEYCAEQSPPFINGVLDKMAKRIVPEAPPSDAKPSDPWLADALGDSGNGA